MASASRTTSGPGPRSPESFESLARRSTAAEILQSYEFLSWHSFQRCESLAQTRLHFQNVVAGFTDADEASLADWKTDNTPRPKPGDDAKGNRKGKYRLSSGAGGHGIAGGSAQSGDRARANGDAGETVQGSMNKKRKSGSAS